MLRFIQFSLSITKKLQLCFRQLNYIGLPFVHQKILVLLLQELVQVLLKVILPFTPLKIEIFETKPELIG